MAPTNSGPRGLAGPVWPPASSQASSPGPAPQPVYADVYRFTALLAAFRRARRAKRGKGGEPEFYHDLEANLLRLSAALADRSWVPQPYRYFELRNKKRRVVSEAAFTDRVVHHALVAAMEPVWEPHFAPFSYACRKGKGVHAALRHASGLCGSMAFALRMDVRRYFDNVDHEVLMRLLAVRIDDPGIRWLCATILAHANVPHVPQLPGAPKRGIPIGNLTSQFWANVYLDPLDRAMADLAMPGRVLRYMDDLLIFDSSKTALWTMAAQAQELLETQLRLDVKHPATVVLPVQEGVPWLGFRMFPATIRLDAAGRRRLGRRLRASERRARRSAMAETAEVGRAASCISHAAHANTMALRRSILARCGPDGA